MFFFIQILTYNGYQLRKQFIIILVAPLLLKGQLFYFSLYLNYILKQDSLLQQFKRAEWIDMAILGAYINLPLLDKEFCKKIQENVLKS